MHKNIERIISLALLGVISSNNAITLASEINPDEIKTSIENNENEAKDNDLELNKDSSVEDVSEDNSSLPGIVDSQLNSNGAENESIKYK